MTHEHDVDPHARTELQLSLPQNSERPIDRARESDPPAVRVARVWGRVIENLSFMAIIVTVGREQAIEWWTIVLACAFVIGLVNSPWTRSRGRDIGIFSLTPHVAKALAAMLGGHGTGGA
jgi:hypothetical protein